MSRASLAALLLSMAALAQTTEPRGPNFPTDGKPPSQAEGTALLKAVCGDKVQAGEQPACECPVGSNLFVDGFSWKLTRVTRGHFLSPFSDDAVLAMDGCEPHSENWGGTVLLTRGFNGWRIQWYKAGVITSECHKAALPDSREILICLGRSGAQGNANTELYVEDLLHPGATLMMEDEAPFFRAPDNILACPPEGDVVHSYIDKVEFSSSVPPAIDVIASYGSTSAVPGSCPMPAVKSYHLNFRFRRSRLPADTREPEYGANVWAVKGSRELANLWLMVAHGVWLMAAGASSGRACLA